jgi:hypothetical protein
MGAHPPNGGCICRRGAPDSVMSSIFLLLVLGHWSTGGLPSLAHRAAQEKESREEKDCGR